MRVRPIAVVAVVTGAVCMIAAAAESQAEAETNDSDGEGSLATGVPTGAAIPVVHGMEIHGGNLHVLDYNAWMQIAPRAVEVSMQEVGTDPVALTTNIFRRLFPDHPWPPPQGSGLCDKWEAIVRAVATAVGRPLRANLEVMR